MKKLLSALLTAAIVICLCACTDGEKVDKTEKPTSSTSTTASSTASKTPIKFSTERLYQEAKKYVLSDKGQSKIIKAIYYGDHVESISSLQIGSVERSVMGDQAAIVYGSFIGKDKYGKAVDRYSFEFLILFDDGKPWRDSVKVSS